MTNVWVTNRSGEELTASWDGKKLSFRPNSPFEVPLHIAEQIFGYGQSDKTPVLIRLGWTKVSTDIPAALERLSKFEISETRPEIHVAFFPRDVNKEAPLAVRPAGPRPTAAA
jgi:hypothetical protein